MTRLYKWLAGIGAAVLLALGALWGIYRKGKKDGKEQQRLDDVGRGVMPDNPRDKLRDDVATGGTVDYFIYSGLPDRDGKK